MFLQTHLRCLSFSTSPLPWHARNHFELSYSTLHLLCTSNTLINHIYMPYNFSSLSLIMKRFPNDSSSTIMSTDKQDTPSNSIPRNGDDVLVNNLDFGCLPQGTDLNPTRMVVAEMVGTFILMFCVCGIMASTQVTTDGQVGLLEYALTAGLTVVVLIFSIGPISGAHVNPAVTLALAIFGHFPWSKVPLYVIAQTVGSVVATYVGKCVYGIKSDLMTTKPLQGSISAFWVELLATFIVMFLVASLTNQYQCVGYLSAFAVGIAIGLAVLITGPVSGGSMNPARSLGPAIVSWNFTHIWIYITAPTVGAVSGALLYRLLRIPTHNASTTQLVDSLNSPTYN